MERNLTGFAEACFDMNSIDELRNALNGDADFTDCAVWDITQEQWRDAITEALNAKLDNAHLYIYDGDGEAGQVVYDGYLSEFDGSHADPALLAAIERAKTTPNHVRGKDREGCPFTVLVSDSGSDTE